jgi:DNA repair protein RadC
MKAIAERSLTFQPILAEDFISARRRVLALRELPTEMQPEERMARMGAGALSTQELLALLIERGGKGLNAMQVAEGLLVEFGGLHGVAQASLEELLAVAGMTESRASRIKAALELGRRQAVAVPTERTQIRCPADLAHLLMLEMGVLEQEQLRIVAMDTKNFIIKIKTLYQGSLNAAVVRVAEIFKWPIRLNAGAIALVHNHPSGDPTPSPEDVRLTEQVTEMGAALDIVVLDHLIIGHNRWVSLKERGLGFH